jgi:UDP-2-acetamido-2-deoxy-ribo-hexuluronate aminotransferase
VHHREHLQTLLKEQGIPTAVHYPIPLNKQPAVADYSVSAPVGDKVAQQVMSLPMGAYLRQEELAFIVETLSVATLSHRLTDGNMKT